MDDNDIKDDSNEIDDSGIEDNDRRNRNNEQ